MKYQLASVKPVAAKKPFDFEAAAEALNESLERTHEQYQQYIAAEGRVLEIDDVLSDCKQALESISKFGVVAQNMAILNEGNGLDQALGLENLAIESIASLSESTKAMLQKQYCAGLEGKLSEGFNKLVEAVKEWFTKAIAWLKEFFTGNAKIAKMVSEAKFDNIDFDAKCAVYSSKDCAAMISRMNDIRKAMGDLAGSSNNYGDVTGGGSDNNVDTLAMKAEAEAGGPDVERQVKKLSELGWGSDLAKIVTDFKAASKPTEMDATWKKVQDDYRAAISKTDESKIDALKTKFKAWRTVGKLTGIYGRLYKKVGFTLLTISKKQKAATPAA